tara:strand:+ start:54 stop:467 length:414 start_codon:yes stop_codon:yes gene_type:complete
LIYNLAWDKFYPSDSEVQNDSAVFSFSGFGVFHTSLFKAKEAHMIKKARTKWFVLAISLLVACIVTQANASGEKVNINTAGKEILMTLKGVGDKIADRIIAYRQKHPFKVPEDIMNVKGIGQKVFEANKEIITVQDG